MIQFEIGYIVIKVYVQSRKLFMNRIFTNDWNCTVHIVIFGGISNGR